MENRIQTYGYCLDEEDNLVCIDSITDEDRHTHKYRCLQCGQEMIPKLGKIKIHHFAHKVIANCNGESYLHKLAKRRIREKFMSSETFPITFSRLVPCCEKEHCLYAIPDIEHSEILYYNGRSCSDYVDVPMDLKVLNGKTLYDECHEEVRYKGFRPDLMLTCSSVPNRPPIFVEIYKTHKSDDSKLASGIRIIETRQINSEADIDVIIKNGFIEGRNCQTYYFNPTLPKSIKPIGCENIIRFVLRKNDSASIFYDIDEPIRCDKIYQKIEKDSVEELNLKAGGLTIGDSIEEHLDLYQVGLLYFAKKGYDIRNCKLCKFRRYNSYKERYICILYKKLGLTSPYVGQVKALECQNYEFNHKWDSISLEELQKVVQEVPNSKN